MDRATAKTNKCTHTTQRKYAHNRRGKRNLINTQLWCCCFKCSVFNFVCEWERIANTAKKKQKTKWNNWYAYIFFYVKFVVHWCACAHEQNQRTSVMHAFLLQFIQLKISTRIEKKHRENANEMEKDEEELAMHNLNERKKNVLEKEREMANEREKEEKKKNVNQFLQNTQ